MQLPLSAVRSSEVTSVMRENLETIGGVSYIQVHPVISLRKSVVPAFVSAHAGVEKKESVFMERYFLRYLAGYGLGQIYSGISENRQAD